MAYELVGPLDLRTVSAFVDTYKLRVRNSILIQGTAFEGNDSVLSSPNDFNGHV